MPSSRCSRTPQHDAPSPRPPVRPPDARALLTGAALLAGLLLTVTASAAAPAPAADPQPGPASPLTPVAQPEVLGPVFPIAEEDMRTTILRRLRAKLPELQQQLRDSLRTHRVPATPRPTTDTARTVLIDPSITLSEDITTPEGQVLARAGDRVNPLRSISLLHTYLVLNAADPRQLAWAARELGGPRPLTTVLLTEGQIQDARKRLPPSTRIYPAPPDLFARFPVDSVPARVSGSGDQIRIEFIPETALPDAPAAAEEEAP